MKNTLAKTNDVPDSKAGHFSRRRFLSATGVAAAAVWLSPRWAFVAEITAHENTLKHLSTTTRVEGWNFTFPPAPAGALPTKLFAVEETLHLNGATLALKYYPPAHTDLDISVEFTDADILHVADTWWNGHFPFINYSTGGSIDGAIRAAEANVARVTDKTIVIPRHGRGVRAEIIDKLGAALSGIARKAATNT